MNYLAHIFLSGESRAVKVGNFIGDFVKGSQFTHLPGNIQKGIVLHRKIDYFTDNHQVVRETIQLLRPEFGRYSGIVTDMYFDYFLAVNFRKYGKKSLHLFSADFYLSTLLHYRHLPNRVQGFIFHFISTHRLYKYRSIEGLRNSLEIMSRHKSAALEPDKIIGFLTKNTDEIEEKFHLFFPDLIVFAKNELGNQH